MMDLIVIGRDAVYRLKPSSPPHVLSFAGVGAGSFYLCQKLKGGRERERERVIYSMEAGAQGESLG